jgi:hypothetical protein
MSTISGCEVVRGVGAAGEKSVVLELKGIQPDGAKVWKGMSDGVAADAPKLAAPGKTVKSECDVAQGMGFDVLH